jgi:MFS family permease
VLLAVLMVAAAWSLGSFWAPAMAMLSDASDAAGLDQALAAALMNLGWAGGQIIGSGGGGALAKATSDAWPMTCAAIACVLTLLMSGRVGQRPLRVGALALRGARTRRQRAGMRAENR